MRSDKGTGYAVPVYTGGGSAPARPLNRCIDCGLLTARGHKGADCEDFAKVAHIEHVLEHFREVGWRIDAHLPPSDRKTRREAKKIAKDRYLFALYNFMNDLELTDAERAKLASHYSGLMRKRRKSARLERARTGVRKHNHQFDEDD